MIEKLGGGAGGGRAESIMDFSSSFRGIPPFSLEPSSPAATSVSETPVKVAKLKGPFSGLVICVTGLSKEVRTQVQEATERLGGQYSPHLHPQCTHLVVQSFHGLKFKHAMKHGTTNGLFLVAIGWFVDSVKRNVRLDEMVYSVYRMGDYGLENIDLKRLDQNSSAENSCLLKHIKQPNINADPASHFLERQTVSSSLAGQSFYVDVNVPAELRTKVAEALSAEGASLLDQWFIGCDATHVVCEGSSIQKYLGHSSNVVTPLWVLKSAKENFQQRLVHLSADLARYTGAMLHTFQHGVSRVSPEVANRITSPAIKTGHEVRLIKVNLAKDGVRKRRNRRILKTCQTPIRPIMPGSLLDSICWSISEPTSTVTIYTESSSVEDAVDEQTSMFFDAKKDGKESEASFVNLSRPLKDSEKSELIFKGPFLTIMFPVDRFSEMGPCSRTFFSNRGFTCLQVLDYIYAFYQEKMSSEEIELAIHTDSRHADRLRSIYSSQDTLDCDHIEFRRIDFLGSRKSFEMLKRVAGDNNNNLYELLIGA